MGYRKDRLPSRGGSRERPVALPPGSCWERPKVYLSIIANNSSNNTGLSEAVCMYTSCENILWEMGSQSHRVYYHCVDILVCEN